MDFAAVADALGAAAVAGIAGMRYAQDLESINAGVVGIMGITEIDIDYNVTMKPGAIAGATFTCGVFFERANMATARKTLSQVCNTVGSINSFKGAIEADRTLGGVAKTLNVSKMSGAFRLYTVGGLPMIGAMFDVDVWA